MTVKSKMSKSFKAKSALRMADGGASPFDRQRQLDDMEEAVGTAQPKTVSPLPGEDAPTQMPVDTPQNPVSRGIDAVYRGWQGMNDAISMKMADWGFAMGGSRPNPLLQRNPDGSLGTPVRQPTVPIINDSWMRTLRGEPAGGYEHQVFAERRNPMMTVGVRAADGGGPLDKPPHRPTGVPPVFRPRPASLRDDTDVSADAVTPGEMAHGGVHAGPGRVEGPGGPREDKIPAMYSDGEYVLPAKTVDALGGPERLDKIVAQTNDGIAPHGAKQRGSLRMATGGDDEFDPANPYNRPRTLRPNPLLSPQGDGSLTANPGAYASPEAAAARTAHLWPDGKGPMAASPGPAAPAGHRAMEAAAMPSAHQTPVALRQAPGVLPVSPSGVPTKTLEERLAAAGRGRGLRGIENPNAGNLADYNMLQANRGNNIRADVQDNGVIEFTGKDVAWNQGPSGIGGPELAAKEAADLDAAISARLASNDPNDRNLAYQLAVTPEQRARVNAAYAEAERERVLRTAPKSLRQSLTEDRALTIQGQEAAARRKSADDIAQSRLRLDTGIAQSEAEDRAARRDIDRAKVGVDIAELESKRSTALSKATAEQKAEANKRLDAQINTRLVDPVTQKPDPARVDRFKQWMATADAAAGGLDPATGLPRGWTDLDGTVKQSIFDLSAPAQERALEVMQRMFESGEAVNQAQAGSFTGRVSNRYDPFVNRRDPEIGDIFRGLPVNEYARAKIRSGVGLPGGQVLPTESGRVVREIAVEGDPIFSRTDADRRAVIEAQIKRSKLRNQ